MDFFSYFIYLGLLFSVIGLLYFANRKDFYAEIDFSTTKFSKITFYHFLALIIISVIVGYRYNVGTDWDAYRLYFIHRDFETGKGELAYRMINQFIYWLNGRYTHVFFIIAFLSWYFIFKSVPRKILPLSIFFLFCDEWFFFSNNLVRQFVALGIFLYSIKFLANKNVKQFIIWVIIAGYFHMTAWLMIPIFLIPWQKLYNRRIWIVIYFISFFLGQNGTIINFLPRLFERFTQRVPVFNIYVNYFYSKFYETEVISANNLGVIFKALIGFYIIYFSKNVINRYPQSKLYFSLFFVGMIITNIFIGIPIVSRFAYYFIFVRPFLLALIVYYSFNFTKTKFPKYLSIGVILLYFILYLYLISIHPYNIKFIN